MTAAQIAGWAAFAELEPFGPLRDDLRAAAVASVISSSIPFRGRGAKNVKPADIFESLAPPFRTQTAREMAEHARQTTIAMGGEVKSFKKDTADGRPPRRPGNRNRRGPERARR